MESSRQVLLHSIPAKKLPGLRRVTRPRNSTVTVMCWAERIDGWEETEYSPVHTPSTLADALQEEADTQATLWVREDGTLWSEDYHKQATEKAEAYRRIVEFLRTLAEEGIPR